MTTPNRPPLDRAEVIGDLRAQVASLRYAVPEQVHAVALRVDEAEVLLAALERADCVAVTARALLNWLPSRPGSVLEQAATNLRAALALAPVLDQSSRPRQWSYGQPPAEEETR